MAPWIKCVAAALIGVVLFAGGAAGSAAGVMIGNSLTSGDEKKPEQKE